MTSPMIEVRDLVKRYKGADKNAVDGVTFSVGSGELFALLGPNGAGKTTTISIVTTTLLPTSGSVQIGGHDVRRDPSKVRQEIGIIFQKPSLDQNLTAEENVRLHAVLYGLYPFRPTFRTMPAQYQTRVRDLATVLGIEDELFTRVKTFSGGMKRKLEVVRSLIHSPKVLFLDEPTLGLDPSTRRNLWEYVRDIRKQSGTTVFLTTHYLEEAEEADQICVIDHGKIMEHGTPTELKSRLVQHYVLLDADDRIGLRSELQGAGVTFAEGPPIRIDLDAAGAQRVIRSLVTPLTMLETHMPTLEDAYLDIVGPDE